MLVALAGAVAARLPPISAAAARLPQIAAFRPFNARTENIFFPFCRTRIGARWVGAHCGRALFASGTCDLPGRVLRCWLAVALGAVLPHELRQRVGLGL